MVCKQRVSVLRKMHCRRRFRSLDSAAFMHSMPLHITFSLPRGRLCMTIADA